MNNVCRYAKAILKYIFGDWLTLLPFKNAWILYRRPLFTPGAVWGTFYYRCTHFISQLLDCWQKAPAYPIVRLGGARKIFNKTDYIRLKEESHIHLMLWGGVKHRLIFVFVWTNPLIVCVASAEEESIKLSVLQSKLFLLYSNNSL